MDHLAAELGVRPRQLRTLQRELGPHDLRALASLAGTIRAWRPDILHTHMAKAGTLGRLAAVLAGPRGPDRKSTRLNSSHPSISYAVFCLQKKKQAATPRSGGSGPYTPALWIRPPYARCPS